MENGKEIHIGDDVSKATLDISDGSRFERIDTRRQSRHFFVNTSIVRFVFLQNPQALIIKYSLKVLAKDKRISSSQTLPHQRDGLCNSNYGFSISGKRETIFANLDTSWS